MLRTIARILPLAVAALSAGCASTGSGPSQGGADAAASGPVVEIAIRRLKDGQDVAAFERAREAFVQRLRTQSGVTTDREFQAIFDFTVNAPPTPPVYIGMTQYATLGAFQAAGAALGNSAEAGAFFSTFTPKAFTVLRPLDPSLPVDLAKIAHQPGNVLEVAYRDLSRYPNLDRQAYAASRDALLGWLRAQPGVLAEYQWVSALDPNLVVGMTVYRDQAGFQSVAAAFAGAPAEAMGFLKNYPPAAGYVNAVVR